MKILKSNAIDIRVFDECEEAAMEHDLVGLQFLFIRYGV